MNIIFLDMDGVLVIGHQVDVVYDWDAVRRLYEMQQRYDAKIVLSSDWRYNWEIDDLISHIESQTGFDLDIISSTPQARKEKNGIYIAKKRGDEIRFWVGQNDVDNYVIIDDLPTSQFNEDQQPHLVTTEYEKGLTYEKMSEAFKVLD